MQEARIVKLDVARGFGFLRPTGTPGRDIFFHVSKVRNLPFDEGLLERVVQFEATETTRGLQAIIVQPPEGD